MSIYRSQCGDQITGWTIRCLNPDKGTRRFSSPKRPRLNMGPTQPSIQCILQFFPETKRQGHKFNH